MTYPQAQSCLNSFVNYERLNFYPYKTPPSKESGGSIPVDKSSFRLNRVKRLLRLLGNPHQRLRAVHIAGSKGKGSTCIFVGGILREAGFKVGLYTSPHLVDVRERIKVLQPQDAGRSPRSKLAEKKRYYNLERGRTQVKEEISRKDFARLIERIKPYAEKLRKTKLGQLSYYEILTALAFLYFKEEECDFVVLETGIGGRLDATNVACSLVCAITPISYEHTRILGTTLEKIAAEKAGIIKNRKRQIVVTAPQRPSALKVIRKRAKKVGAVLYQVGKDIQIRERSSNINRQSFDVKGILAGYSGLKIGLLGEHQIVNAALAIACVESLRDYGVGITQQAIREGLKKAQWPGRLQLISQKPKIILDAAHNRASACALKDALNKFFRFRRLILVFGVSLDKDVRGILRELLPLACRIILTKTQNPRALAPEIIKTFIKTNEKTITLTQNPIQALKIARQNAGQQDLILICGSLFLIGEVLKSRGRRKNLFLA